MPPITTEKKIDKWFERIDKYGLPLAMLVFVIFCLITFVVVFAWWAKPYVVRAADGHIDFVVKAGTAIEEISKTQTVGTEILRRSGTALERIEAKADRTEEMVRDLHGHLVRRAKQIIGDAATEQPQSGN